MATQHAIAGFSASENGSDTVQVLAPSQNITQPAYCNVRPELNLISCL